MAEGPRVFRSDKESHRAAVTSPLGTYRSRRARLARHSLGTSDKSIECIEAIHDPPRPANLNRQTHDYLGLTALHKRQTLAALVCLVIDFQVLCLAPLRGQDVPMAQLEHLNSISTRRRESPMNDPINLTAPRIKEGGVTIWYGQIAYRNCHVQKALAGGRIVRLSTSRGVFDLEWMKIPLESRAKLFREYSNAEGVDREVLRTALERESKASAIETFRPRSCRCLHFRLAGQAPELSSWLYRSQKVHEGTQLLSLLRV